MEPINSKLVEKIKSSMSFLLFTHVRPDGDALGSSFGLRDALRAAGKKADVVIPYEMPDRYRSFFHGALLPQDITDIRNTYECVLVLDCATFERIETGGITLPVPGVPLLNLDHHRGNTTVELSDISHVDPEASSTCHLAVQLAKECGLPLVKTAATSLLVGMMTDTGNFRFSNTTGETLRTAAELLDCGAELEQAVNTIYFSKSMRQRNFETDMVSNSLKFLSHDRIAYAFISDEMLKKHNFDLKEDEGIIDILREIGSVVVAILIHKKDGAWKLSMRSKDTRCPVGPVARMFGGGGHDLAAGATIEADTLDEVLEKIIPPIEKMLDA